MNFNADYGKRQIVCSRYGKPSAATEKENKTDPQTHKHEGTV